MSIDKVGYAAPHQPMIVGDSSAIPDTSTSSGKDHPAPVPQQAGVHASASVDKAVSMANERMKIASTSIRFSKDEESGRTVIKMVDQKTNQVIRQFPTEEMLRITHALDKLQGVALSRKA
jgi:flagellar protein FlaG